MIEGGVRKERAVFDGEGSADTVGTVEYVWEGSEMMGRAGLIGVTGRECVWYLTKSC